MRIPSTEELENKFKINFWTELTITATENIFFRIMWIDMIIPAGFSSDGASIPRTLRVFINEYNPKWLFAAICHDYIYRTQFMPRVIADNIFRLILRQTAWAIYSYLFFKWVRVWWWIAWFANSYKLEEYPTAKHDLKSYICNNGSTNI